MRNAENAKAKRIRCLYLHLPQKPELFEDPGGSEIQQKLKVVSVKLVVIVKIWCQPLGVLTWEMLVLVRVMWLHCLVVDNIRPEIK